jgi:hypothetical protein
VTVAKELSKYKLDFVGVQEVRWEGSGTELAGQYTFLYGKENENHELGTDFLCIRKPYQQLIELSLLVRGCHTNTTNTKRWLLSYYCLERSCPNRGSN